MSLLTGNTIAWFHTPEAFVVNQAPTTQVGFEKVAGQTGIFVFARESYKIYFKNTAGQWVRHADITEIPTVNKGLTYPWGDYTAVCFAAANPKLKIHIHVRTGNILVDNTPQDPNDDDFTLFTPSGASAFQAEAYDFPNDDGTDGQVLTTDGAGNVTWQTIVHPTELPASPNEGELLVAGAGGNLSWEGPLVTKLRLPHVFHLTPQSIYVNPAHGLPGIHNRADNSYSDGYIRPSQVLFERIVFDTMKDKYGLYYGELDGEFNAPLDGYYQINLHMRWKFGTLSYYDDNRIDTFIALSDKPRHLYLANGEDQLSTLPPNDIYWQPDSNIAFNEPNVSYMKVAFQDSFEIPYEFGGDTTAEYEFDRNPSVAAVEFLSRHLHTTLYLKKDEKVRFYVKISNETTLLPGNTKHQLTAGWGFGMPGVELGQHNHTEDFLPTEVTITKL